MKLLLVLLVLLCLPAHAAKLPGLCLGMYQMMLDDIEVTQTPPPLSPPASLFEKAKAIAAGHANLMKWLDSDPQNNAEKLLALQEASPDLVGKLDFILGLDTTSLSKPQAAQPVPFPIKPLAPAAPVFEKKPSVGETSYDEVVAHLKRRGLEPTTLNVGKASNQVKDVPFGKFKYGGIEYDYATTPAEARKVQSGSDLIFFGRTADDLDAAKRLAERYFTEGVDRAQTGVHFDIRTHQRDTTVKTSNGKKVRGSSTSGFSNGSEVYSKAETFAQNGPAGIVAIMDVAGQEVLSLNAWHEAARDRTNDYQQEHEVLTKGGRSPKRVVAIVVYQRGSPVAFYKNPNYEPGGGKEAK